MLFGPSRVALGEPPFDIRKYLFLPRISFYRREIDRVSLRLFASEVVCTAPKTRAPARCKSVDHCGQPKKDDKGRIPDRVEDVTGDKEVNLLDWPRKGRAMEEEDDREEYDED